MRKILPLIIFPFLFVNAVKASHVSGGEITYQYLDSNKYKVTLNLFRDCSGIPMDNSQTISFQSSCNSISLIAPLINPGGTEISQLCSLDIGNSTCNGGTIPGMEKYIYQTIVTLIPCTDWVISWSTCCRNTTVNIPTSSGDYSYFEATLNNVVDTNNTSSSFLTQPIPSVCVDQLINFNLSASNDDDDSLVFSFIAARGDVSTPLSYTAPYSATNPIVGISINQSTGDISFTPNTLGNFIVVVQVAEYNSQGVQIGTVMRDIQFVVVDCSGNPQNTAPEASSGTISNLTGTAVQLDPYSLQICSGGDFSFDIQVVDSNSTDSLTISSDIASQLPGAIFTVTNGNPATATISWTDTGAFTGSRNFVITATDNICPYPGVRSFVYTVNVISSTFSSANTTICGTQSAQLFAGGGSSFTWTSISGDPIIVGTNFSCNPCNNPVATPSVTTTYVVTSNLTGSCTNTDTVTVAVVADFSYTKTQSQAAVCKDEEVQFVVSASGTNTFQWNPAAIFDNPAINNPIALFDDSGTNTVYFTITNADGCSKTDSMSVVVSPSVKPEIIILADTTICAGSTAQLDATIGNSAPELVEVGTSSTVDGNTTYPAPYGNWYMGVKHQLLFTASELINLGFGGGTISSLAFNIESISGTTSYTDFEIKMGSTTATSLTTWQTGLVTVMPAQTINITAGWNIHTFSTGFNWDGTSNLMVEVCFNNQPNSYTYNSPTYYTPTTFTSVIYFNADNNPTVCTSPTYANTSVNRPNIRFYVAGGGGGYSYAWSPSFGLDDDSIATPVATISSDTSYTVIVVDTIGGCSDTASVNLTVVPDFTYTTLQSDSNVCRNEEVQFVVNPSAGTYTYLWSPSEIFDDSTVSNPIATFDSAGAQTVFFTVSNSGGCNKPDSLSVLVGPSAKPNAAIFGDSTLCAGSGSQLNVINNPAGNSCNYSLGMFDSNFNGWDGAVLSFYGNGSLVGDFTFTTGYSAFESIPVSDGDSISISFTSGTFPYQESYILYNSQGDTIFEDGPQPANGAVWSGIASCPVPPITNSSYAWSPSLYLDDATIANPFATPASDTTFTVIVTDTIGGCGDTASITLVLVPDFTYTKAQSDSAVCMNEEVQFQITPSAGTYNYLWSPPGLFADSAISNPIGMFNTPGLQTVYVEMSNVEGCNKEDSMTVMVSTGVKPEIVITADTTVCAGGSVTLNANFASTNPAEVTIGTGTLFAGNTTYPAPYGNWYMGVKHQFLFTAAELNALNFSGGMISSLAFNIESISGTTIYNDFEIKMGQTSVTSISTWESGLATVFPAQTINITTGWNVHSFSAPFNWDGNSNLVVEVCFNNQPASYTYNSPVYYTPTSFTSVIYYNADGNPTLCSNPVYISTSSNRPDIKFSVAGSPGDAYSYAWSPSFGLDNPSISNPVATISSDTSYTVVVTDTVGGCSDTASINLMVVPNFNYTKAQTDSGVCLYEDVQFTVTPDAGTYTYLWSPSDFFDDTTIANPVGSFDTSGLQTVYVVISSSGGCDKTDSMTVAVSPSSIPNVMILADTTLCGGQGTVLNVVTNSAGTPCDFRLDMFDSNADGWDGAVLNVYSNGSLIGSYTLATGDSASVFIPVVDSDTLAITYTSGAYPYEESYVLYNSEGDTVFADGPIPGQGAVWSGLADCSVPPVSNSSYSWSPSTYLSDNSIANPYANPPANPPVNITYTVIVMDTIGQCGDTASINLTIVPVFSYLTSQSDTVVCLNENVQFVASATGGGYTYEWSPGNIFNNSSVPNPTATLDSSGIQWVYFTISSSSGCDLTDSMSVLVSPNPKPNIILYGNFSICPGDSTQITASVAGSGYSFDWTPGSDLSDSAISNPFAFPLFDITYSLVVTDTTAFCSDTATVSIDVLDTCGIGIEQILSSDRYFGIYPNPSNGKFVLTINRPDHNISDASEEVTIMNVFGEVVYQTRINSSETREFDLKNFASGVYFIQFTENQKTFRSKIIIE